MSFNFLNNASLQEDRYAVTGQASPTLYRGIIQMSSGVLAGLSKRAMAHFQLEHTFWPRIKT